MIETSMTECELQVMKTVWESEKHLTLPEIMSIVNAKYEKKWKPQTVSTFLARLVKKGFLASYRVGRTFCYQSIVPEKEYRSMMIVEFVNFWADGNIGNMFKALQEKRQLSKEELEIIKSVLAEIRN